MIDWNIFYRFFIIILIIRFSLPGKTSLLRLLLKQQCNYPKIHLFIYLFSGKNISHLIIKNAFHSNFFDIFFDVYQFFCLQTKKQRENIKTWNRSLILILIFFFFLFFPEIFLRILVYTMQASKEKNTFFFHFQFSFLVLIWIYEMSICVCLCFSYNQPTKFFSLLGCQNHQCQPFGV